MSFICHKIQSLFPKNILPRLLPLPRPPPSAPHTPNGTKRPTSTQPFPSPESRYRESKMLMQMRCSSILFMIVLQKRHTQDSFLSKPRTYAHFYMQTFNVRLLTIAMNTKKNLQKRLEIFYISFLLKCCTTLVFRQMVSYVVPKFPCPDKSGNFVLPMLIFFL